MEWKDKKMANNELLVICEMLNAMTVIKGYSQDSVATYAKHITEHRITTVGSWQLRDKLYESHDESLNHKRGEELEELGIYEWYIPTDLLIHSYTNHNGILYYDLAGYIITDYERISDMYQVAKRLSEITC